MALLGGFMTAGISPVAAELTQDQQAVYDAVMANLVKKMNIRLSDNNIVAGRDIEVYGGHNAVFGTDYMNGDNKLTKVAGNNNTVIGVGNLVGYTAILDETDNKTWIYKKRNFREDQNVAVGMNNTVNGGGIAIGTSSEVKSLGTSVGHGNEIISQADYGLALGNYLKVDGDRAIAVGSQSKATASRATAIGQEAMAKANYTTAIGQEVIAEEAGSVAIGMETKAITINGVALGSYSVADRAKGAIGYLAGDKTSKAWKSNVGALSIGGGEYDVTRQITGVAAGSEDTDAVNVAQLKALNTKVDNGAIHYFSVNSDDKNTPDGTNWKNDGATGENAIAIGKNAVSEGSGSIAIGKGSKVFNTNASLGMAIGAEAESSSGSIVIGKKARDYDTDPKNGAFGVYIGYEAKSLGGSAQTVIGNYGQAKGEDSTAIGTSAQALGRESLAVGSSAKSLAEGAASFGTDSIAEFDDSTALGSYANGRGNRSVASGAKSIAAGHNSVAIGYQSFAHNGFIDGDEYKALSPEEQKKYFEASGLDGYFLKDTADGNDAKKIGDTYLNTAVGSYSRAYKHATTIGGRTSAKEEGTAVGTYAKAYKKGAASLGYKAQSNAENGVALGAYSFADREKGTIGYALGGDNSTLEKALESTGQKARYDELTSKIDLLKDEYNGLLKVYMDAPANSAEKTTAKDKLDEWKAAHPDFLPAVKEKRQMIAAWQSGNGAVSVGTADASRQITNVAAGSQDTDAVNVAQLKAVNTKVDKNTTDITELTTKIKNAGSGVHYFSVNSDDKNTPDGTNWKNDGATGENAIAIGKNAVSTGEGSVAIGNGAKVFKINPQYGLAIGDGAQTAHGSIVIGKNAKDYDTDPDKAGLGVYIGKDAKSLGGIRQIILGNESQVKEEGSTVIGDGAKAIGWQSLAVGEATEAWKSSSSAFGAHSRAMGENSTAIGHNAQAYGNGMTIIGYRAWGRAVDGVALGANSVANVSNGVAGWDPMTGEASTDETLVWKSSKGAVSVGDNNNSTKFTRQIVNVAAGTQDTDAVNIAQLKKVNDKVNTNTQSITDLTTKVDGNTTNITNINKKIENLTGSSGWTLAVARGDDSQTDSEATAEGASKKISGDTVTLKAGRGVKLKQDGANVQIGLKFIDMNPAGSPFNDAKAIGGGSLAVGQNSVAGAHQATAVGLDTEADEYGVALGTTSRAGKSAVAIGSRALADGTDAIAIGTAKRKVENDPTQGYRKVDSDYAIAIGGAAAVGEKSDASSAVGYSAEIARSEWSNAFGGFSKIENSKYASTFGTASKVENAAYGTALGGYSEVQGAVYGTALGTLSSVQNAAYGTALGSNARVIGAEGGVAIGAHSVAERKASMMGYKPIGEQWKDLDDYLVKTGQKDAYDQAVAKVETARQAWEADKNNRDLQRQFDRARAELAGLKQNYSIWVSGQGAVSIGDEREGFTRQLTGLAAGTKDTDAVNVAQLKSLATAPMNFYFGGSKNKNNTYTPGTTNWSMPLNEFRMDFGDGLKAEQVTDQDGKKYTLVTLDKDSLKGDPAFKGDKGEAGKDGAAGKDGKSAYEVWKEQPGNDGKTEKEFLDGLKGKDGVDGKDGAKGADGKDGKSAYDTWKEQPGNEGKTEKEFLDGLKGDKGEQGEKGADGKDGAKGADGKSAYDTWKEQPGNDGKSEQDFINSLKGKDGADGTNGTNGEDGKSAYEVWKAQPGNDGKSEQDFINSLKGKDGADGTNGTNGEDGKSAYEVWRDHKEADDTQPNKDKSEKEFLDSLKGKDGTGGAGGTDFTVTADGPKADSKFKVDAEHAQLNIVGDKTNITTSIGADNTVKVALNKDIKVDSVEVGSKDGKPGVKIDGDGINMNGKKIENLAPGTAANDAATVGQVNEVRDESREGDAMNAALAALKPLDFDPYNRSQVMAGVSTYKGKQAVAVGLAHYSNEDTLVHAGIAYGGSSDLMANAGISWRFGDKDDRDAKAERDARMPQYADGPISSVYVMQDEMAALRAENQSLKEENKEIKRQVEMLMKHAGLNA